MNAITYGKNRILREIPMEILKLAFLERHSLYNNNISLDEKINYSIINPIVLMDTNLIGSITKKINLKRCIVNYYTNEDLQHEYLIEIPDDVSDHKEVISVSQILNNIALGLMGNNSMSAVSNAMNGLMSAHSNVGIMVTDRLEIVGRNIVLVNTGNVKWNFENSILECGLAKDRNMGHLKKGSYLDFGELCVEAAKIFIYNKLYIKLDEGYILGGHNISAVKSKVESYESAFERYKELLEQWFKIEFMNDSKSYADFIEMQLVR